jgi:hypothetical protein
VRPLQLTHEVGHVHGPLCACLEIAQLNLPLVEFVPNDDREVRPIPGRALQLPTETPGCEVCRRGNACATEISGELQASHGRRRIRPDNNDHRMPARRSRARTRRGGDGRKDAIDA